MKSLLRGQLLCLLLAASSSLFARSLVVLKTDGQAIYFYGLTTAACIMRCSLLRKLMQLAAFTLSFKLSHSSNDRT